MKYIAIVVCSVPIATLLILEIDNYYIKSINGAYYEIMHLKTAKGNVQRNVL